MGREGGDGLMDAREAMRIARPKARKLARQGRLIDESFKVFQRLVFPGAPPDQVAALRTTFFAGAQEIFVLMTAGVDDGDDITDGDMEFMQGWAEELERFHAKTIAAANARGPRQ